MQPFERFFGSPETVRHFRNYSRGLLSDIPRKTAEPLAQRAGTPPRCLQQFLKACLRDHDSLTDGIQQTLRDAVADLPHDPVGTVAILDETSALKKGTKTPGVPGRTHLISPEFAEDAFQERRVPASVQAAVLDADLGPGHVFEHCQR